MSVQLLINIIFLKKLYSLILLIRCASSSLPSMICESSGNCSKAMIQGVNEFQQCDWSFAIIPAFWLVHFEITSSFWMNLPLKPYTSELNKLIHSFINFNRSMTHWLTCPHSSFIRWWIYLDYHKFFKEIQTKSICICK